MSGLRRFWFQFERTTDLPAGVRMGCGVTAFDREDAIRLLRERVFSMEAIPPPTRIVEDIDITSLDAGHVRPNMGNPVFRGIWFPLGYGFENDRVARKHSHDWEAVLMSGVTLKLTADQALVLFDWLAREGGKGTFPIEHQAEQNVLWEIEAQLEKTLVASLQPDYEAVLAAARERLVAESE